MFDAQPVDWGTLIIKDVVGNNLLDMFKTFMGIEDNSQDAELSRALSFAGDATETYLDRIIAKRQVSEYYPHHFGVVTLHHYPIDTQAGVTVMLNGETQTGYDVYLTTAAAKLTRQSRPQDAPMDWRQFDQAGVMYTAGYDPLPTDIANALCYTAAGLFNAEGTGSEPGGASGEVKSMSLYDVGSMSFDVGSSSSSGVDAYGASGFITDTAAQLLSRYKRLSV